MTPSEGIILLTIVDIVVFSLSKKIELLRLGYCTTLLLEKMKHPFFKSQYLKIENYE